MNTTVAATGMEVKASSTGGLAIASYTDAGAAPGDSLFASSATALYKASATLQPTSTPNCTDWYTAKSDDVNSYEKNADGYTKLTQDYDNYRLESKFQVKSLKEGDSGTAIYITGVEVSVKGSTTANASDKVLNKTLRVAIVYGTTTAYYAPVYGSGEGSGLKCVGTSGNAAADYAGGITIGTGARAASIGTVSTSAEDLLVYVYYEGEDPNCKSNNAINIDTLQVSLSFSTTAPNV